MPETDEEDGGDRPLKKQKAVSSVRFSGCFFASSRVLNEQNFFAQSLKKASSSENTDIVLTDASGDKYIDLGKKKRATVRTFKGE